MFKFTYPYFIHHIFLFLNTLLPLRSIFEIRESTLDSQYYRSAFRAFSGCRQGGKAPETGSVTHLDDEFMTTTVLFCART
jgi:hypothetical protein